MSTRRRSTESRTGAFRTAVPRAENTPPLRILMAVVVRGDDLGNLVRGQIRARRHIPQAAPGGGVRYTAGGGYRRVRRSQARDLAKPVESGWPATAMMVFTFCIVRPTHEYPGAA